MKKTITFLFTVLLTVLFTASCSKENLIPSSDEVEVTFSFNLVETGIIPGTKASFTSEVLSSLSYKNPEIVYLRNYATGETYTLDFTKSTKFYVKPGNYFAYSRKGNKNNLSRTFYSTRYVPLEMHDLGVATLPGNEQTLGYNVTITNNPNQVLEVRFSAIVIACKKDEVSSFRWRAENQDYSSNNLGVSNEYYFYVLTVPDYLVVGGDGNRLTLTVEMGGTDTTETTTASISVIKSSRGNYYIFSPNQKDCKIFDNWVNVDEWHNGFDS